MYNDAWDDYYDDREDAREDWQDHREDLADERGDRASNAQEQRTERQQSGQQQRTEAQQTRQQKNPEAQAQRDAKRTEAQAAAGQTRAAGTSQEARGQSRSTDQATRERSGTKSDAFSGYSSGKSERASSQRGQRSREQLARRRRTTPMRRRRSTTIVTLMALAGATLMTLVSCTRKAPAPSARTFATPEDAVKALVEAVKAGKQEDVVAIFGPDGQELADSSDPATARRNRDVFTVAAAERWQLVDEGSERKVLVVGNEGWPFPVPLAKVAERLAVRHRRGKRGSARQTNRPQRAGGHPGLPHLRRSTAALCQKRTRWTAGGTLCPNVLERSGPRERTLLARGARPEAQSAG